MNPYRRALRNFQDYADDVQRARYRTFQDAIRRVASTLVPGTPLGEVAAKLPEVDLPDWYSTQLESVGSNIGSGTLRWPDDQEERLALQLELVRSMAEERFNVLDLARNFLYVQNSFDDHVAEFGQQVFRPFVRDFLRFVHRDPAFTAGLNQADDASAGDVDMSTRLALFVSHSSNNASVAKALVTLFEKALKISAREIRCSSVNGYRLPAGAETNEQLRSEVFQAEVMVALLTPQSLNSQYVLFELGARWGARRPLFPVLAVGVETGDLEAPLNGLNALSLESEDQVRQLLEDTAVALSVKLEPSASFSGELNGLIAAAAVSP